MGFTLLMLHSDGFQVQQSSTMGNVRKLITPLSSSIMNDETMRKSDSDEPFENISLYDLPSSKIKKIQLRKQSCIQCGKYFRADSNDQYSDCICCRVPYRHEPCRTSYLHYKDNVVTVKDSKTYQY